MSIASEIERLDQLVQKPFVKSYKLGGYEFLTNSGMGYYPYFSLELRKRVRKKLASNIVVVGEGGIGKTYLGTDLCRVLSPKKFDIEMVVFTFNEFMRAVSTSKLGVPICFDEPSYAMSKKDWYNELNKALVKTIESFRFKVHPLFIPVINKSLLDKTVRNHLIQFQVVMRDRGKGTVYRLYPSQFKEKIYSYEFCKIEYDLFDNHLCSKDSCIDCDKLDSCMIFRAQYERKKSMTQEERYARAVEEADKKESSEYTDDELEAKCMLRFDSFYIPDKQKIDVEQMKIVMRRKDKIIIPHNRAYRIVKLIEFDHPQYFTIEEDSITEK